MAGHLDTLAARAEGALDYARWAWFTEKAAALRRCTHVVVVPDPACGGGAARPLSCHVRGEPDCERTRSARLLHRFIETVEGYVDAHGRAVDGMARPAMLTLTVANVDQGLLGAAADQIQADFGRLRRRAIIAGGPCRWRWRERGPTGVRDGAPGHPCHEPIAADACLSPRCDPACPASGREGGSDHLASCDSGCPTRTGRRQSHCPTHVPRIIHPSGCPRGCPHAGHRRDRNCPAFRHDPVPGGLRALDITFNPDAYTWHPHLHALVDLPWLDWAELRDTWQASTCHRPGCRHGADPECGGSWMVWISSVPTDPEARQAALREVLKYVAKPAGIIDTDDPDVLGEFLWATRARRMVAGFGTLHRLGDPEFEPDAEGVLLRVGEMGVRVPTHCPHCGRPMGAADWGTPYEGDRWRAEHRSTGWVWHPPPEAAPTGWVP